MVEFAQPRIESFAQFCILCVNQPVLRLKWKMPMLSVSWLATMSHSPDGSNWKWRGVAPRVCWYDGLCGRRARIKRDDSPLEISSLNLSPWGHFLFSSSRRTWMQRPLSSPGGVPCSSRRRGRRCCRGRGWRRGRTCRSSGR